MAWSNFVGSGIFWIGLIGAIVLYAIKSKWYPIAYLISVLMYVFTVCFVIDVFNLSKNWILLLLAFSAILMTFLGMYLSKKNLKKKK
jgi:hypothetical protein